MLVIKALIMSFITVWRVDLPPQLMDLGSNIEMVRYEYNKALATEHLDKWNPKVQALRNFFAANKNHWKYDFVSYTPQVILKGNGITINCRKHNAVVSYKDQKGELIQLSSDNDISASYCGLINE